MRFFVGIMVSTLVLAACSRSSAIDTAEATPDTTVDEAATLPQPEETPRSTVQQIDAADAFNEPGLSNPGRMSGDHADRS